MGKWLKVKTLGHFLYLFVLLAGLLSSCLPSSSKEESAGQTSSGSGGGGGGGGGANPVQSYTLSYSYQANRRLWFDVVSTSGFSVGDTVFACRFASFGQCNRPIDANASRGYEGRAVIYHVDRDRNRLYVTTDPTILIYRDSMHLWNSTGTANTRLTDEPMRLYRATEYPVVLNGLLLNASDVDQTNAGIASYSSEPSIDGNLAINPNNSNITEVNTLFAMDTRVEMEYVISARSTTDGSVLATHRIRLSIIDPPTRFTYSRPNPIRLNIGSDYLNNVATVSPLAAGASDIFFDLDPNAAGLPAGIALNDETGLVSGVPSGFTAGSTSTVRAYHPASGAGVALTADVEIITATDIDEIYVDQPMGRTILLEVNNTRFFNTGGKVSSNQGTTGTITFVDRENNDIFITMDDSVEGPDIFRSGNQIDASVVFVTSRAIVERVFHVINTDGLNINDLTVGANPITTTVYNDNAVFNGVPGEVLTHRISPPILEGNLVFCVDDTEDSEGNPQTDCGTLGGGSIVDVDAPGQLPIAKTVFRINVANSLGRTRFTDFGLTIVQLPTDLSLAQLQYVPINPVVDGTFHEGTFISARPSEEDQTNAEVSAKIIDVYRNADGNIEGLLIKAERKIEFDEEIDNEVPFYSAETAARQFQYLYVTDTTPFTVGSMVSSSSQGLASVLPGGIDIISNRLAVELMNENFFALGHGLDNQLAYANRETVVIGQTDQSYVNFIATLTNSSNFELGEMITSANGATGWVVFNDTIRHRIYVRHLSGTFNDGDVVNDAGSNSATIESLKSNYISLEVPLAEIVTPNTSFLEGQNIVAYDEGAAVHIGSGMIFDSDDIAANRRLSLQWESGSFEATSDLTSDNYVNSFADQSDPTSVSHENAYYVYSGIPVNLQTYLRGSFTSVEIDPPLPSGLSLNPNTGEISGTPNSISPRRTYNLTVRNASTPVSYQFELEVLSQFYVYQETLRAQQGGGGGVQTSAGNSSSYVMHKSGQGFQTADCRVTNKHIVTDAGGIVQDQDTLNDIVCFLDGGEEDLYFQGINFKIHASPGMCEYITYWPYGYYNFPPFQTRGSTVYTRYADIDGDITANCGANTWSGQGVGTAATDIIQDDGGSNIPTQTSPRAGRLWGQTYCETGSCAGAGDDQADEAVCLGRHQGGRGNNTGPNCDEGSYVVNTYSCAIPENPGPCVCTMDSQEVECGGDRVNCAGGPITATDGLDPRSVDTTQGLVMFSFFGMDGRDIEIPSPDSRRGLKVGNTFVSNWTSLSQTSTPGLRNCVTDQGFNYDADGWEGYGFLDPTPGTPGTTNFGSVALNLLDPTFGFGRKSYEFQCNDSAGDIKARVRVYVRDWNRDFSPADGIDNLSEGVAGSLLATNKEDTSADNCFGLSCNGFFDWDDLFTSSTLLTSAYRPTFDSCSAHAGESAVTVDIIGLQNQRQGLCDNPLDCINFYPGMVLSIDGLAYLITGVNALTGRFTVSVPFVENYPAGAPATATILRNIPFPLGEGQ